MILATLWQAWDLNRAGVTMKGCCRLPLAPELSAEDMRSVENVTVIMEFLVGSSSSDVMPEVAPLLPQVATQMLPDIIGRLTSRISARALRELYLSPAGVAQ